jgi:hypothetical protein
MRRYVLCRSDRFPVRPQLALKWNLAAVDALQSTSVPAPTDSSRLMHQQCYQRTGGSTSLIWSMPAPSNSKPRNLQRFKNSISGRSTCNQLWCNKREALCPRTKSIYRNCLARMRTLHITQRDRRSAQCVAFMARPSPTTPMNPQPCTSELCRSDLAVLRVGFICLRCTVYML